MEKKKNKFLSNKVFVIFGILAILICLVAVFAPQLVKLFEQPEKVVVMAGGQHPLSKAEHLTLKDIIHEDFILMPKTSNYRHLFDAELARQKLEVHPFLELDAVIQ